MSVFLFRNGLNASLNSTFFLIAQSRKEGGTAAQCPRGWSKLADACYRVYGRIFSRSWTNANNVCRASRANLVSITSSSEQDAIWGLTKAHSQGTYGFWIGLKRSPINTFA